MRGNTCHSPSSALVLILSLFLLFHHSIFVRVASLASPRHFCSSRSRSSEPLPTATGHRFGSVMSASPSDNNENTVRYPQPQFKVLGVCGGIGSGKSSACKLLVSELGCTAHLDADSIAHNVYSPGSQAVRDIVQEFGVDILLPNKQVEDKDNSSIKKEEIDRKKLGAIVFADRSAMSKLEHIVWPHVKTELQKRIDELREDWKKSQQSGTPSSSSTTTTTTNTASVVVVLEAAVLLDADWDDLLDGIWVVTASKATAKERLVSTRGLSEEEASKRIAAQESRRGIGNLKDEVEKGVITAMVTNNGSLEDLQQALAKALDDPKSWKTQ